MDGWKDKCNECGLELNVMIMHFVTATFSVTVHWPSASGIDFERPLDGVPLLLFASSVCLISSRSVEWLQLSDARVASKCSYCVVSYGGSLLLLLLLSLLTVLLWSEVLRSSRVLETCSSTDPVSITTACIPGMCTSRILNFSLILQIPHKRYGRQCIRFMYGF